MREPPAGRLVQDPGRVHAHVPALGRGEGPRVVAASAGNHAQGVALAAQMLGISARSTCRTARPCPRLVATRAYGATIEQVGTTIDECLVKAREWEAWLPAGAHPPVRPPGHRRRAGHLRARDPPGVPRRAHHRRQRRRRWLLAGISTAVKALKPDVRVIGVQAEQAAAYPLSLAAGKPRGLREHADDGRRHRRRHAGRRALRPRARPRRRHRDGQRGSALEGPPVPPRAGQGSSSPRARPRWRT